MPWTSPLDSRPLKPVPLLWLLVPWAALLAWNAATAIGAVRSPPASGLQGLFAALGVLAVLGIGLLGGALGLVLTWFWLALAVPGIRRPGLWLAAACLATAWCLPKIGDTRDVVGGIALLCGAACLGAMHSVLSARVRAREVWGTGEGAGV